MSQEDMVPVGTILPYGGNVLDAKIKDKLKYDGWLVCDGNIYDKEEYSDLYEVIGQNFGRDGDKPRLPDFRGLFLRGVDHGRGRDPDAEARTALNGGAKGDNVGSFQEDEFKAHSHKYSMFPKDRGEIAGGRYWEQGPSQTDPAGGNETRPKNIYVNFIIKAK